MAVAAPFELLDLADGGEVTATVRGAEEGEITFTPRGELRPKTTAVLRLFVDRADKPAGLPYIDVTARTLIAQVRPIVLAPRYSPRRFTIRKVGAGLSARFSVSSGPIGGVTAA